MRNLTGTGPATANAPRTARKQLWHVCLRVQPSSLAVSRSRANQDVKSRERNEVSAMQAGRWAFGAFEERLRESQPGGVGREWHIPERCRGPRQWFGAGADARCGLAHEPVSRRRIPERRHPNTNRRHGTLHSAHSVAAPPADRFARGLPRVGLPSLAWQTVAPLAREFAPLSLGNAAAAASGRLPALPQLPRMCVLTGVALEVVEYKGLKSLVVFFSVALFGKSLVFNDFVFQPKAIRA